MYIYIQGLSKRYERFLTGTCFYRSNIFERPCINTTIPILLYFTHFGYLYSCAGRGGGNRPTYRIY